MLRRGQLDNILVGSYGDRRTRLGEGINLQDLESNFSSSLIAMPVPGIDGMLTSSSRGEAA